MSKNTSKQAKVAIDAARDALAGDRLEEAEARAREVTNANPRAEEAWHILAEIALRQGRVEHLGRLLQDAIGQNPRSASLFALLGNILFNRGQLDEAHTAFEQAHSLDPADQAATFGLANVLAHQGRYIEAIEILTEGAAKAPDQPRFPFELALAQLGLGHPERALPLLEAAVAQSRELLSEKTEDGLAIAVCRDASAQLGTLLFENGQRLPALNHLDLAVRLGAGEHVRTLFAECVGPVPFAEPLPHLQPLLERAIIDAWIDPSDLVRVTSGQIRLDPEFAAAMDSLTGSGDTLRLDSPEMDRIAGDTLLLALLNSAVVSDATLERLLTAIRTGLLKACGSGRASELENRRVFAISLANQCFFTDYAYAWTDEERSMVDALETKLAEAAEKSEPIAMMDLIVLAAYRPLHRLAYADKLRARDWPDTLEPLLLYHLREPGTEADLAATIAPLTVIDDETSKNVRAQYEESPFPRWIRHQERRSRIALPDWLGRNFPHLPPPAERYRNPATPLNVLVAGCGTGRDAIATATRFPNADVLAIDLSRTSMGYALRKTRESNLSNLTYGQADILEIEGLGRQFDVVECAGVLHHLADPVAGWRALAQITKPGGYMLMAMYSELGRRDLDPAIAFAKKGGYGTDDDLLRRFRADVLALPAENPVRRMANRREDFYNLSMLRDLVFHVHEERFTIARIEGALKALGLEFGGFAVIPDIMADYFGRFGATADPRSLKNWDALEQARPDMFSTMYHFLAIKPESRF